MLKWWVVVVLISKGDGGIVTFKYPREWGTFCDNTIGTINIYQRMAR
jgi:hypothetical protein